MTLQLHPLFAAPRLLPSMKRKRSYKRFKPVQHDHNLERHLEVRVDSRGRVGGRTTYRKGPSTLSPPRSDTEEIPHAVPPPPASFDADPDNNMPASSSESQSTDVRVMLTKFSR